MLFRTFKQLMQCFIYNHPEQGCFMQSIDPKRGRSLVKWLNAHRKSAVFLTLPIPVVTLRNCHGISGPRVDLRDVYSNPAPPGPCSLLQEQLILLWLCSHLLYHTQQIIIIANINKSYNTSRTILNALHESLHFILNIGR